MPVEIPSGVQVSVSGPAISVQGSKGKLEYKLGEGVAVEQKENTLVVSTTSNSKQAKANFGTTRSILSNMVVGASTGWKKKLELHGTGYNASLKGTTLTLNVGLSHQVIIEIPAGVTCKTSKTTVELESADKQVVGNLATKIRSMRPPEPYLGKGIRLSDEVVRRKAGKTGK